MKFISLCFLVISFTNHGFSQQNEEIFDFEFEGSTLNGIINYPENAETKGLVMIVHGAGCPNSVGTNLHGDIRKTINQAGYTTYMYDKKGCGNSEGVFDYNQPVDNSAEEVIIAIKALQAAGIAGTKNIGLWGISRAGWINPIVISKYKDIAFWITVSGVDDKENFNYLFRENLRIEGYPTDSIELLVNELEKGVRLTHSGARFEEYLKATQNLRKNPFLNRFNGGFQITEAGYYEYQKEFMKKELDENTGLEIYIPNFEQILSDVHCPVLAIFGEMDMNVNWKKTEALYSRTIPSNQLTIRSFPNCNHNIFQTKTGAFYEFEDTQKEYIRCDGYLETLYNWLKQID
ncbi:alpha/beta hydrolase family protein [Algoriphagus sediminis]|uniref:Alpha/beta hydrolase n=1 Tax=Algoriphagus sediminis TaxID=3057113 RepID=A0ABT7YDD4_9BACT|nr:alpha/beta hydrolase [Algoriphagus sediminis]MDN3204543.1 alpha/beta hydrolase [Algoriphagus sediminis]